MPGISSQDPISETSGGFIAPYDPAIYSKKWGEAGTADQMHYQCGINFFWQNSVASPLPGVPMYRQRVDELASQVTPGLLKYPLTIRATWSEGAAMPKGDCHHLSPCEWVHAVLFKVASEIKAGITDQALEKWRTTLLSTPAVFVRIDSDDEAFAEANSLRQEAAGYRRAVEHSARQLVYNIWALKLRKEAANKDGKEVSAQALADFWLNSVRVAAGNEHLHKKSTLDTCLTLYKRVFSIPECEALVAADEAAFGPESVWNSIFKLQEVVYRCGKPRKILWLMAAVSDWIHCGKCTAKDITVSSLKTGQRSVSDIALQQLAMRDYLLGPWMDSKNFPPYMKSKCREVFDNRMTYRQLYMPVDTPTPCTWMFSWPKFGHLLVNFLEAILYSPNGHEEFLLRQAVKNSNTPEEIVSWRPWSQTLADIATELARTADASELSAGAGAAAAAASASGAGPADADSDAQEQEFFGDDPAAGEGAPKAVHSAAARLETQLVQLVIEPPSLTALTELLKTSALATLKPDTGRNCLILIDCNVFGEADSQPHLRMCPMSQDLFRKWLRAIRDARGATAEDDPLNYGDIFLCFNGAKDRKRIFSKPLASSLSGKDQKRTVVQTVLLHMTEESWRERRGRHLGRSKLTQQAYICATSATLKDVPKANFATYGGSTKSDVVGPVALNPVSALPKLSHEDKIAYLGKRRVAAGGREPISDDSAEEDDAAGGEDPEDGGAALQPISFHCLPVAVTLDFVKAFQVRHVVDFTPSPLPLPLELVKLGISYLGVCATENQRDYIKDALHTGLVAELQNPESPLHDPRIAPGPASAGPPPPNPANTGTEGGQGSGGGGGGGDGEPEAGTGRGGGRGGGPRLKGS